MACVHRITGGLASYCYLESSRLSDEEPAARTLVFHGERASWPMLCDQTLSSVCPFRERREEDRGADALVRCPYCKRRHRSGSTSKRLCEDWHSVKSVLGEMRTRRPRGRLYFEEGTTILPYRSDTPGLVRQIIWPKLKVAVVRRDRYTCQVCGANFGKGKRKVYDPGANHGRGGYAWERLEVHHIIPRSKGGSDHPGNLKTLCPGCHRMATTDFIMDRRDERRREMELIRRMAEMEEDDDWEPPFGE